MQDSLNRHEVTNLEYLIQRSFAGLCEQAYQVGTGTSGAYSKYFNSAARVK